LPRPIGRLVRQVALRRRKTTTKRSQRREALPAPAPVRANRPSKK